MKKTVVNVGTFVVTVAFIVIFVGVAYYMGKPVYDGILQLGWIAVLGSILCGALVGAMVWVSNRGLEWLTKPRKRPSSPPRDDEMMHG